MNKLFIPIIIAAFASTDAVAADYLDRSAWTWKTSSECAAEEDIVGLKGIYDGNTATCWHSNYHAASGTAERTNPHWVMIDRGSDTSPVYGLSYIPRQNSNLSTACTQFAIYFADKSLENTTAASAQEIYYQLGDPDVSGSWEGTADEKTVMFESPVTSRYILFVNIKSNGSNSAACAEMNLIGSGGGTVTPSTKYNAIQIETPTGDKHRIAIDGENLAFSMVNGNIRMGNSGITVEYAMEEVKFFRPENYTFNDEEFYVGPKEDVNSIPVLPVEITLNKTSLSLESGTSEQLTATLVNAPEDATVEWRSSAATVASVSADGTVTATTPGTATITATYGEASAQCTVTVTEKVVEPDPVDPDPVDPDPVDPDPVDPDPVDPDPVNPDPVDPDPVNPDPVDPDPVNPDPVDPDPVNPDPVDPDPVNPDPVDPDPVNPGDSAINAAEIPTLTLKRDGDTLIVSGITSGTEVSLTTIAGVKVCSAPVSELGSAVLEIGNLTRATYILSASGLTLKIIL